MVGPQRSNPNKQDFDLAMDSLNLSRLHIASGLGVTCWSTQKSATKHCRGRY